MKEKLSECCKARLYNYDKNWDDGVCIECDEHSPAIKEKETV
tara:strand:+ start:2907 stop:3032 length:126 start_codon:yes stop_codon:yes gene_type:complete